ncbi:MAG: NUDIX domain-containing protein [Deltaproteobacteria bacterium]|nr:MAG: NUDIX domain-containing protein [Deltaproteobacteria bacterium]
MRSCAGRRRAGVREEPAEPRPSSTVILLREERGGFSVLMLERHGNIAFPGAHVFPGGIVEPSDTDACGALLPSAQEWAAAGEGDRPPEAIVYWMAAARELFEEVGILLARRHGRPVERLPGAQVADLRRRVLGGEPFGRVLASADLVPATDDLFYFARWITPITNPRRWDTRFLIGRMPAGQEPTVDGTETVSCTWFTPADALAAYESGAISLIPPTVRTLDDLARFATIDAALEAARVRVVRARRPEVVIDGDVTTIAYPDNTGTDAPPRQLVLRDGRWRPTS